MANGENNRELKPESVLTLEQDAILDLYLQKLDAYLEQLKESEKIQVEIETLHLKRLLTK
ncbi:hypothetical protein AHMF7605_09235 [Adhaeribacter arboris]|uniref:Uncharacterized protein n=1 Tax=Adhaeribacter arboris TaxID=2072846 RepID=A0A2T2YDV5_9BACT|nr:hypothetical protein [Adhaeribacter arboris]PSR53695.1 hypothetical protein AHMF7605_09235 [Adhaeribacter arboris]